MTELLNLSQIRPSTYNPRTADPARLNLIELSLRKLGFLLPIYADPDGEILSGHQRHHVATRMGATRIPVARTRKMDLDERKAVNIVFNRGTNDLDAADTPTDLTDALSRWDLDALSAAVPDKAVDTPAFYPCLRAREVPIQPLLEANAGRWVQYAANVTKTLRGKGVSMPVVATADNKVVNGIGRLQLAAESGADTVSVVYVTDAEGQLANAMLNYLSMDFNIHGRYADVLRYNSFRRARTTRQWLGYGFTFATTKGESKSFDILKPAHRARWVKEHGTRVVDFGAGHLTETNMLRQAGIEVAAFEPFRIAPGTNEVDPALSRTTARAFLADVASGKPYSSVFISAVLNSVPFIDDRRKIARILHALCSPTTKLYALAVSADAARWKYMEGAKHLDSHADAQIRFVLNYEPRVVLGDFSKLPKVQKFHTPEEFASLWTPLFQKVVDRSDSNNVAVICAGPRALNRQLLREALEFEFDLAYPDGSRMGLADEAIAAFSRRLGCKL